VHVGFDQYMYIGCTLRAEPAVALAGSAGLFVERITDSPVAMEGDDDVDGSRRPADAGWWAELASLVTERGAVLLEEGHVLNTSRWHRLTTATMDRTRVGLAPRSRLLVWSDLSRDIDTVLATLECDGLIEVVWQEADGELKSRLVDDETYADLPGLLGTARAAAVLSAHVDERRRCWPACSPTPMASCARVGRRSRATPAAGSCRRTMGMASCDAAPSTENPLKVHSGESRGKQSLAVGCG
jgi:small subunit ribosomal protein S1